MKKGQKGQITNLIESSQILPQNEVLEVRCSKKFISRSFKVIEGQNNGNTVKQVKLRTRSINKTRDGRFSKNFVKRLLKVIEGQKSQKVVKLNSIKSI